MTSLAFPRLQWQRVSPGVFFAYPEGDEHKAERNCSVGYHFEISMPGGSYRWRWRALWAERFDISGIAPTKQAAADFATEEWWGKLAETEAAYSLWQRTLPLIAAAEAGEPDIEAFEMPAADRCHLMRIMREVTARSRREPSLVAPGLAVLTSALSAELYRRRIAD